VFSDAEPSPPGCTPPAPPLQGPSPMLGRSGSTGECYGVVERWETIREPSRNVATKNPFLPPRPTDSNHVGVQDISSCIKGVMQVRLP